MLELRGTVNTELDDVSPVKRATAPISGRRWTSLDIFSVEAPGIEPGSENRSTTATTCVVRPWMFPRAGWQTTHSRMSPLYCAGTPKANAPASPDLRYPQSRPGRASSWALAGVTKSYAARAKLLFAVGILSSVLSGARRPEHAATASLTPSKPVAPMPQI